MRRYLLKFDISAPTRVLLASSYGATQMMGQSLLEVGFLAWFAGQYAGVVKMFGGKADSSYFLAYALEEYCANIEWQLQWGLAWMAKKRTTANNTAYIEKNIPSLAKVDVEVVMLRLWNGDIMGTARYAEKFLEGMKDLKAKGF
jgi:hypothetical protein